MDSTNEIHPLYNPIARRPRSRHGWKLKTEYGRKSSSWQVQDSCSGMQRRKGASLCSRMEIEFLSFHLDLTSTCSIRRLFASRSSSSRPLCTAVYTTALECIVRGTRRPTKYETEEREKNTKKEGDREREKTQKRGRDRARHRKEPGFDIRILLHPFSLDPHFFYSPPRVKKLLKRSTGDQLFRWINRRRVNSSIVDERFEIGRERERH